MFFSSKKWSIAESGLLCNFTDWHSHILPGVDDGARTADESLQILRRLESVGVARVYLTPHIMDDFPHSTAYLRERFEKFRESYQGQIQLMLASENMIDNLFEKRLNADDILPLGEKEKGLLMETSCLNPYTGLNNILLRIKKKGYIPVLAHPERYRYMEEEDYLELRHSGALFQLNLPSLTGAYGKAVRKKALMLLDRGWYDLCGLDIHSSASLEDFLWCRLTYKEILKIENIIK
ncbi:MAG: capsular biosynthesis protein [Dysgonamonadaceae bacterium]|jgi:tyrosine-protein phosphatase YwqE|nr:capsular biosynthesis protein [Dysgonamonadaceae bacterium]